MLEIKFKQLLNQIVMILASEIRFITKKNKYRNL